MLDVPLKEMERSSKIGTDEHLILQPRDLHLLSTLSLFRIVDREQASLLCGFKSLTRVNARLLKLRRAGLLKRFFFVSSLGGKRAIYCLSGKGAALIDASPNGIQRPSDSFLIGDRFVAHQLAINQVYCAASSEAHMKDATVQTWRSFPKPISADIPLIPDAYFEIHSNEMVRPMFLEVDLGTEGLSVWNKKLKTYLLLATSGEFERLFQKPRFAVLVVASSERRMHSLRANTKTVTTKLFYFSTAERIAKQGFWHSIWLRPEVEQDQSLI